ncbi:MAG TPA: alkaline phosphatase PhoX [Methyloversatilis sp.]
MIDADSNPFHPLCLDDIAGRADLAGCRYIASRKVTAKDGRAVVYLTEAAQPEHLYKFVGPAPQCGALAHGTLYVASLGEEGHGRWLPLVLARHGLSVRDGYASAEAILAYAAAAARRAGASAISGLFAPQACADGGYLMLCDKAGPALIWREALGDAASLTFVWHGAHDPAEVDTNIHFRYDSRTTASLRT